MSEGKNSSYSPQPKGRSLRRMALVTLVLLVALAAIAYGVYSLTSNSTKPNSGNHTTATPNTQAPNVGSKTAGTNNGSSSASGSAPLSNTGPGDSALYAFIASAIIGTLGHYGWRHLKRARS